jgi:protein-disulfide isomerase
MEEEKKVEKKSEVEEVKKPEISSEDSHSKSDSIPTLTDKMRENPWILSTLVLGVLSLILIVGVFGNVTGGSITGSVVAGDDAGETLVEFLNENAPSEVKLDSVEEESGLYKVNVEYEGEVMPLYSTLDGKYFVQGLVPIASEPSASNSDVPQEIVKSDKPKVELFVMTHCPYGTQAEKGFLPTMIALGDKIDASIKFVHYFLHDPEETETPVQICIREEQGDKFNTYLKEFLIEGDTDAALKKASIDKIKLDACIESKYEDLYAVDSALSEGYDVKGSPTLVVNGEIASSGRSADAYLKTICSAFNEAPEECELVLDSETPSPGFGYGTTSGVANAQC